MAELSIATDNNRTGFRPGEAISGTAAWSLERSPASITVRLFWRTEGQGAQDVALADTVTFEQPERQEARPFLFVAPSDPVSFSGRLITLVWALELVVSPGKECARLDLVISPTGQQIHLGTLKR
jgi:hypothetical protein